MKNAFTLHTAINANGKVNANGFSLNLWILNAWNTTKAIRDTHKNLASFKNFICITLTY